MAVMQQFQKGAQSGSQSGFSIEAFKLLFNSSVIRKYLSIMDVEQIRIALEDKDIPVLAKLYQVLLEAEANDEKIVRDFVITKNKILDSFYVEAMGIEKKFVEGPMKKRSAKAQAQDVAAAEDILKQI